MTNAFLLLVEALGYFGLMAVLFALRGRIGLGVFMTALAGMHFLETYLASVFYVAAPLGILSPGSTVLFSGKLVMLLLLYMKEDAATVRQPIYGLLVGNLLTLGLVGVLRFHSVEPLPGGAMPDMSFIDDMGWLMAWGTALLFIDAILIILLYEALGRVLRTNLFLRIFVSVAIILTFDQIGFFTVLHLLTDAPWSAFFGGWAGKMAAALVYSMLTLAYLRWFERGELPVPRGVSDVFEALTYRERYNALVEHAGRDALTGLMHRGRFNELGAQAVATSQATGRPLTLLIIDVDHFKSINDHHGHAEGDRVLQTIAATLVNQVGPKDTVFRIGGEEFAVLCPYPHALGRLLGETIRQVICLDDGSAPRCTVSVGVATTGPSVQSLEELFALADRRLYMAKDGGRNRVVGEGPAEGWTGSTAISF
ncbi:GGDEF domain-containing protein [Mesorhizobium australicum]|uniref:diguanylate cyclase n=1 Tax=Mesorhizobium australicum TaxID=536018 RepID=A0A1X7PIB9_9HYPH|nr:GGDEF domain-containing protein [Mesorhizobium australicum]SMH50366.1 diguanylate cyclase (GGDEF) domain-containing protein [Mesorhizobium australicum]